MDNNTLYNIFVLFIFYGMGALSSFMLAQVIWPGYFPWVSFLCAVIYCMIVTVVFNMLAVWQARKAVEIIEMG